MRTTLKRGLGRGAELNGDGRPVLPPAARSPITRYRQPPPPRRGALYVVGKIVAGFLVSVLVLAVGLAGGVYLWAHESVAATRPHSRDAIEGAQRLDIVLPGKPATALVIGYDHRAGPEGAGPSRSDTVMLLRADPETHTLSMLSFPRDLQVPIWCPGQSYGTDRINVAYSLCGSKGTLETVRNLTGIPINYLITVNFRGFKQVVDQLGGVWIDVDRRYFNDNSGLGQGYTYATINLKPGYQRLNGSQALDFVRYRHTDSDLYRVARQQAFVKAAKQQLSSFSVFRIPKLVGAVTGNTEIGQAGGKGIDLGTLKSYAFFLYRLKSGHFFQPRIENLTDTGPANAELAAPQESIDEAVREFLHPDVEASDKATATALGRKPKKAVSLPPSEVSITVLNGNGVDGSASTAAYLLGQRGYQIVLPPSGHTANAPTWNYFDSWVYYDPAQKAAKRAAKQVADLFAPAKIGPLPPKIRALSNDALTTVIVGHTFHGTIAPSVIDRTPKRQPPYVRKDPGTTLPTLKPLRKRVPFRLQLPTVLERSSSLDSELPARLYELDHHKAVRLVYRTGGSEYWGIEQTDWEDAPALAAPNAGATIKHRRYQLYYSGSHLHMVVLKWHGATYWVVNTLLDSLSNETMLAIAKGLTPMKRR